MALFIACTRTQEEIDEAGLSCVVNKRRYKRGGRPGITCEAVTGGLEGRRKNEAWLPARRKPGVIQVKKMLGLAIKYLIKIIMVNHF